MPSLWARTELSLEAVDSLADLARSMSFGDDDDAELHVL